MRRTFFLAPGAGMAEKGDGKGGRQENQRLEPMN